MNILPLTFVAVTVLCSGNIVKDSKCDVACKWASYDQGCFKDGKCVCVELKDYGIMTGTKRLRVPRKTPEG